MAIDSKAKRFGLIGLANPTRRLLPEPAGGVATAAQRALLAYCYPAGVGPPRPSPGLVGLRWLGSKKRLREAQRKARKRLQAKLRAERHKAEALEVALGWFLLQD